MAHEPGHAKFRPSAVESSLGELRRNFPRTTEFFSSTTPFVPASAFPQGSRNEMRRTRELLNPDFTGVVTNALTGGRPDQLAARPELLQDLDALSASPAATGAPALQRSTAAPGPLTTPQRFTTRETLPGVTETFDFTTPEAPRQFTNLLPASASPEQTGGFRAFQARPSGVVTQGSNAQILQNLMRQRGELPSQSGAGFGEGVDTTRGSGQVNFLQSGGRTIAQGLDGVFQETGRQANRFGAARVAAPGTPTAPATTGFGRRLEAPVPEGPAAAGAITRTGETGFDIRPTVARGGRRETQADRLEATQFAPGFGEAILEGRARREAKAAEALASTPEAIKARQEEQRAAAGEVRAEAGALRDERRVALEEKRFTALQGAKEDLGTVKITPSKVDPTGIPFNDPETGKLVQPRTSGLVKIGDTEFPLEDAQLNEAQIEANRRVSQFRLQNPGDTTSAEALFNRALQSAVLDIITRSQGLQPQQEQ